VKKESAFEDLGPIHTEQVCVVLPGPSTFSHLIRKNLVLLVAAVPSVAECNKFKGIPN
jgi:hypothetical protein